MYAFFFQAEDGIRDYKVTGVQTCALPISAGQLDEARRAAAIRETAECSTHRSTGMHPRSSGPSSRRAGSAAAPNYARLDRKSTRLNSSHLVISYAVFCLKKKNKYTSSYID